MLQQKAWISTKGYSDPSKQANLQATTAKQTSTLKKANDVTHNQPIQIDTDTQMLHVRQLGNVVAAHLSLGIIFIDSFTRSASYIDFLFHF